MSAWLESDSQPMRLGLGVGAAEAVGEEGVESDVFLAHEAARREVAMG